jgi:hypothetical protein
VSPSRHCRPIVLVGQRIPSVAPRFLDLPRSLINGLKHLSVQEGVTLYMVFLAGFVALPIG